MLLSMIGFATLGACAETPSTDRILADASKKAKASGKNVLVIFHASWCGWCHRFDAFLADKTGQKVAKGLEIVHITVLESKPEKKPDENPGGLEFMEKLGGKDAGLPFMAIVNPAGKMLINSSKSKTKMDNIGYPGSTEEIAHFIKMLEVGAPKIETSDRTEIEKWLKDHAPKQ